MNTNMRGNSLLELQRLGQSIWIDYIHRGMLGSGELAGLIEDGVRGVTTNPSLFEKAIDGSHEYDGDIEELALRDCSPPEIYEALAVQDVQMAADRLRPYYDRLKGRDGFVSLEVSPLLAHDPERTVAEARRLWAAVGRPNLFIKVPATREGLEAIRRLLGEGINVNVTLLFGLPRYREVAEAYLSGLEALASQGKPLERLASVASFFLSRIDVLLDPMLEAKARAGGPEAQTASGLLGRLAVASAKVAYQMYRRIFASDRFRKLAARGARPQKLLWASTSTKNPAYSDVKYVEPLIGPDTINTLPLETLQAYRDHGQPAGRLEEGAEEALEAIGLLPKLGLSLAQLTQRLEQEGVTKFAEAYRKLLRTIEARSARVRAGKPLGQAGT
jgi:transaldolase